MTGNRESGFQGWSRAGRGQLQSRTTDDGICGAEMAVVGAPRSLAARHPLPSAKGRMHTNLVTHLVGANG
jgi:hypothetical protein